VAGFFYCADAVLNRLFWRLADQSRFIFRCPLVTFMDPAWLTGFAMVNGVKVNLVGHRVRKWEVDLH